jgi:hypothetical protein
MGTDCPILHAKQDQVHPFGMTGIVRRSGVRKKAAGAADAKPGAAPRATARQAARQAAAAAAAEQQARRPSGSQELLAAEDSLDDDDGVATVRPGVLSRRIDGAAIVRLAGHGRAAWHLVVRTDD